MAADDQAAKEPCRAARRAPQPPERMRYAWLYDDEDIEADGARPASHDDDRQAPRA